LGRVRTFHRALDRLVEHLTQMAPLERLAIIHTYAEAPLIERLQQILEPLAPERPIPVVEVGPVFGAHIGPGCLGVAVVGAEKNGAIMLNREILGKCLTAEAYGTDKS
jgi:fatty acid-binding protein DegV